jgi:GNAT superfamily N-acetyltransferase
MTVTIRPLTNADRAAWEPLWQGYLTFYEATLAPEVTDHTWSQLMADGDDPNGLCAIDEAGAMVGITHYLFHRTTWAIGDYCYLQDLFVAPETRGTGAGRALIEAVYAAAEKQGASTVYWLTQHFNETARQLYDRIGTETPFMKYTHKLG